MRIINYLKENFKLIFITILIYQLFMTIFFYSEKNLIILAVVIVITAGYIIINNYKDDIINLFKR